MASTAKKRGCLAGLPCSEVLGELLVMGARRNGTKQIYASLRMPLGGPPASSSCLASSPRLCIFSGKGLTSLWSEECAGCHTVQQMLKLDGKHTPYGQQTAAPGSPEVGFLGLLPVTVLEKGTELLIQG